MVVEGNDENKKNKGPNFGDLIRHVYELEAKVEKLSSISKCGACRGTGRELDEAGKPMQDADLKPIYCPICNGTGAI